MVVFKWLFKNIFLPILLVCLWGQNAFAQSQVHFSNWDPLEGYLLNSGHDLQVALPDDAPPILGVYFKVWEAGDVNGGSEVFDSTAPYEYESTYLNTVAAGSYKYVHAFVFTEGPSGEWVLYAHLDHETEFYDQQPEPMPGPQLIAANAYDQAVEVLWEEVPKAVHYQIYYGTSSGDYQHETYASFETNYFIYGLENQTTYYFIIKAYDHLGRVSVSEEFTATPVSQFGYCGDGMRQVNEVCDDQQQACSTNQGYVGEQMCLADCSGYTECQSADYCGDGLTNGSEICDGDVMDCVDAAGYPGIRSCLSDCQGFNLCQSQLSCGDGIINGQETCDGGQQACVTASGEAGTQTCDSSCQGFTPCVANGGGNPSSHVSMGSNLGNVNDYEGVWPYVNAFKHARSWVSGERYGCWDCGPVLDLDTHGWIRSLATNQVARTIIYSDADGRYPSGTYTVLYDGEGQIEYWGGGPDNNAIQRLPGRDLVPVDSHNGDFLINLVQTNSANYLRNIRIIVPGGSCTQNQMMACTTDQDCAGAGSCQLFSQMANPQTFHPTFLDDVKSYQVLRFMDWMQTNNSSVQNQADYSQVSDAMWDRGVPVEIMVELANILNADPWFTLPHLATDAYVTQFAQTVQTHLNPQLKVYLEYSNEVWNGIFSQNDQVARLGCARYGDLQAGCDQDTNPNNGVYCEGHPWPLWNNDCGTAQLRYFSDRTVEIGHLFAQAMGGTSRLVRVLGSQVGFEWLHNEYLSWNQNHQHIDALATAPYFGGGYGHDANVANWTVDQLINDITVNALPQAIGYMQIDHQFLTTNYPNIDMISYEGGQHLVGVYGLVDNQAMTDLFIAANRDPRMYDVYTQYLQAWQTHGGGLFTHFTNAMQPSKWGSWGAKEYQGQPETEAPKHRAIMDFIQGL